MTSDQILAMTTRDLGIWLADTATDEDIEAIDNYHAVRRVRRVQDQARRAVRQRGWDSPERHALGQFEGETYDGAYRAALRLADDYRAPVNAFDPPWVE